MPAPAGFKEIIVMAKKRVTFADIAAYTNFSKTTISRYFNDPDSLTLENQQKIADALEALDYKENKIGRILASGRNLWAVSFPTFICIFTRKC